MGTVSSRIKTKAILIHIATYFYFCESRSKEPTLFKVMFLSLWKGQQGTFRALHKLKLIFKNWSPPYKSISQSFHVKFCRKNLVKALGIVRPGFQFRTKWCQNSRSNYCLRKLFNDTSLLSNLLEKEAWLTLSISQNISVTSSTSFRFPWKNKINSKSLQWIGMQ